MWRGRRNTATRHIDIGTNIHEFGVDAIDDRNIQSIVQCVHAIVILDLSQKIFRIIHSITISYLRGECAFTVCLCTVERMELLIIIVIGVINIDGEFNVI